MKIKFLIILIIISLSGCKDKNKSSTEVTLNLQAHQDNFQIPSYISIPSDKLIYTCKSTVLETPDIDYTLETSKGYLFPDQGRIICLIDNLPRDIPSGSKLLVSYNNFIEKGYDYDVFEKSFPIENIIRLSDQRLVRNLGSSGDIVSLSVEIPEFEIQTDDYYSGATLSLKKIFESHSISITQDEIYELIPELRTTEPDHHPREISLLDTKNVATHLGVKATTFSVLDKDSTTFQNDDLEFLRSNTPFLTILSVWGNVSAVAVMELNSEFLIIMHPHLGYLKIEISDLESGLFLNNKQFIVQIFNPVENQ